MATNLRKYTTQEVLNKVYEDASGNTIGINAATSKETLNAALDESNSRLNVSLAGGTISGDVTITGDLTIQGSSTNANYDEILQGNLSITGSANMYISIDSTQTNGDEWQIINAVSGSDSQLQFKNVDETTYPLVLQGTSVGIGATTVDTTLHIERSVTATNNLTFGIKMEDPVMSGDDHLGILFSGRTDNAGGKAYIGFKKTGNYGVGDIVFYNDAVEDDNTVTVNDNVMVFNKSGNVGIGDATPDGKLSIYGASNSAANLVITAFSDNEGKVPRIQLRHSRNNTVGANTAVISGDDLGELAFQGYDANAEYNTGASILAEAGATFSTSEAQTDLIFKTASGSQNPAERMRITHAGNVNMGSVTSAIQATGIHVAKGAAAALGHITIESSSNTTSPPTLHFAKARGSAGSRSAINTAGGDILGALTFTGFDGSNDRAGAEIQSLSVATSSAGTDMPADLLFLTSADGSSSPAERMRITSGGNVGIGCVPNELLTLKSSVAGSDDIFLIKADDDGNLFRVGKDTSDDAYLEMFDGAGTKDVQINTDGVSYFNGGNVGIGDTSPAHKLSIRSSAFIHLGYEGTSTSTETGRISTNSYDVENASYSLAEMSFVTGSANGYTGEIQFRANSVNSTNSRAAIRMIIDGNSRISLSNNDASGAEGTTLLGYNAGLSIVSGAINNTFIGHAVSDATMTNAADNNTGVGYIALGSLLAGSDNTAIGSNALKFVEAGGYNTAVGTNAGGAFNDESHNTFIGYGSGQSGHAANCTAVGSNSLAGVTTTNANGAVAIGLSALGALTTARRCTAVGFQALDAMTVGDSGIGDSTAVGYGALGATTGRANTGIGESAGDNISTGSFNTLLGSQANTDSSSDVHHTGLGSNGIIRYKTARMNITKAHSGDNTVIAEVCRIPALSIIHRVTATVVTKSNLGTYVLNLSLSTSTGTSADGALANASTTITVPEILGAGGVATYAQNSATALGTAADIVASSGTSNNTVYTSMPTTTIVGTADTFLYICNAGTGNGTTDSANVIVDICVEYQGKA